MNPFLTPLALAASALLLFSCDRERSNPIDPQSSVLAERPSTPTGLVAQDDVGRILVAWQSVEEGDLAGYGVYRSNKSNGIYEFVSGDGDSTLFISTGKTTFVDSLDTPGTTLFYRIAAVDTVGLISERSNFVGATVLEDLVPPETPLNLSVVADEDGNDRIIIRWTVPRVDSDGGELSGLSGFVVFRAEGSQGGFVAIDTLAGHAQELVDEGLKSLTAYAYRVMAFDDAGNKSSLTAQQQTQTRGLQVPPNVNASGQIGQIVLSWGGIDNLDLLGYHVFRSTRADDEFEQLPSVEGSDFTTGQTAYIDSNLTGGQVFFYKIQAVGKNSLLSEMSGSAGAEALADELAPAAPSDVSAVPSESNFSQVQVSWNASVRDATGGDLTGLTGYIVYRSEETSASFIRIGQVDGNTLEFLDGSAVESTTYFYAVTAIDAAANEGPRTIPIQIRTKGPDKVAPQAPQNISAIPDPVDFNQAVVRWSPSVLDADGGELTGIVGYVVFRSKGGTSSFVPVDSLDVNARDFVDVDLAFLTTYFYTVSAYDEAGNEGPRGASVQVRTEGPDRVSPQAPNNVSAVADELDSGRITIRWSPVIQDSDGGELTGLAGYVIFRAEGGGSSFVPIDSVGADIREYVDSGLISLTIYAYRMLAYDEFGNESAVSNTAQTQTLGLSLPLNLTATAGIERVELVWGAVEDRDLLGYNVFRSLRSDLGYELLPSVEGGDFTTGRTAYIDSNLAEGQQFFYKVQAVAADGQFSELSGFVDATTLGDQAAPESPRNVAAVPDPVNFSRVVVTWSPALQDVGGRELTTLEGYAIFRSKDTNTAFVQVAVVAGDIGEFVDSGLDVATTYFYTVSAIDDSGNESDRTSAVEVRTDGPDQVAPESPSNASAVADEVDFNRVVVRWSPSVRDADGGDLTGLASYVIFRSKGSASSFVPVDTLDAEAREYVDASLEELTTYFYTVSAIDDSGNESARASSVQVRTEGPDQVAPESPSNLSAVPDETNFSKAVVRWSPSVRDADGGDLTGLAGYVVFRSKGTASSFVLVDTLDAEAREYVDTSLEELTTYFYAISAIDDSGNESARASSVQVRTEGPDQIAPEAPSNLSAVADEADFGRVVVRWSPSVRDADGGDLTGLVSYVVFRSKGTVNSFVPVDTLATTAREFEDLNLNLLTDYFYTVTALDEANNESARANPVQVRTEGPDQIAPATPQNVSAVPDGVDFGRVVVSWSPSVSDADGGDLTGLAGYVVFRSKGSVNAFVPMDTLSAASRQFEDSALESLTTYFYTLMAFDDSGNESSRSTAVQVLTDGPDQVAPAAPSDLAATADLSAAQITVSWSPPSTDADGSDLTGLSSYIVLRSKGDEAAFAAIDTLSSASTSFVDTGLESSTTYFYAVRSIDDSGNASSRSSTISTKTAGIPELTGVAATGDIRQITVTWTGSSEDSLLGYNVYRSTRSDQDYLRQTGVEGTSYTTGQTTYIDSGLTGGATFFYRVSVVTNAGESGLSAFAGTTVDSDTRAPAAPTFVDGEPAIGDPEQMSVTWKQPTTDLNGATLTGLSSYLIYRSTTSTGPFDLVGTSTTTAFTDTGLVAVTTYYYRIEASDQDGNLSNHSTTVALTTGGVDLPSNVRLSSSTPSNIAEAPTVTVRWDSSVGAILHYEVQRTTVANSTTDSDFTSIEPNTLDTFRVDNTVSRGTTYYYRLRARDVDDRFSDWTTLAGVEVEN
ncbi:MAG: hypothetical protein VX893_07495 [Candidatus Latescibacterota bacterium]|nr:hypothetical protein [Candidatus Latescibacterota bacterium]